MINLTSICQEDNIIEQLLHAMQMYTQISTQCTKLPYTVILNVRHRQKTLPATFVCRNMLTMDTGALKFLNLNGIKLKINILSE
jgi:hypothetical protein